MDTRIALTLAVLAASLGCAKPVPEPINVPSGTPHVSWVIMHGDRDNPDAEFACQSTEPVDCVVPASRPDAPVFSDVHLYYHGAGAETTYAGSYSVGYFERSSVGPREVPTKITVRGEEKIANQSTTGIVTAIPGTYAVRFTLEASNRGSASKQPVTAEVPVTVR